MSLDTKPTIDNHEFKNPESGVDIKNEPQLIPMNSALTKVPTARRKSSWENMASQDAYEDDKMYGKFGGGSKKHKK